MHVYPGGIFHFTRAARDLSQFAQWRGPRLGLVRRLGPHSIRDRGASIVSGLSSGFPTISTRSNTSLLPLSFMKAIPPRARSAPFVPLRPEVPDLLEIQDRWFAFSDDCRALTLLGRQYHRSHHCRAQFHRPVICQGHKFFRVHGHWSTPTLEAALQINQLGKSWFLFGLLNFELARSEPAGHLRWHREPDQRNSAHGIVVQVTAASKPSTPSRICRRRGTGRDRFRPVWPKPAK